MTSDEAKADRCAVCGELLWDAAIRRKPSEPATAKKFRVPWYVLLPVLFVLPALVGVLAWAVADLHRGILWTSVTWASVIALGIVGLFAVLAIGKRGSGWPTLAELGLFAYALILWGVWVGVGLPLQQEYARVIVDNFSIIDADLELDGEHWLHLKKRTTREVYLQPGVYALVVRAENAEKELDRRQIQVSGSGCFVLNVLGAQTYYRGAVVYSTTTNQFRPGAEHGVVTSKEVWFQPPHVDYLFQKPPASLLLSKKDVTVQGGTTSRSYFLRERLEQL